MFVSICARPLWNWRAGSSQFDKRVALGNIFVCVCLSLSPFPACRVRPFETVLFSILMSRRNFWNACNLKHVLNFSLTLTHGRMWMWRSDAGESVMRGIISRMNWIGSKWYTSFGRCHRSKITMAFEWWPCFMPSFLPPNSKYSFFYSKSSPNQCIG